MRNLRNNGYLWLEWLEERREVRIEENKNRFCGVIIVVGMEVGLLWDDKILCHGFRINNI